MAEIKILLQRIKLAVPMSLVLIDGTQLQGQAVAFPTLEQRLLSSSKLVNNQLIFDAPPLPPDIGASRDRSSGGGSRGGGCKNQDQQMKALAPAYERPQDSTKDPQDQKPKVVVWGLTTKEHPTFWFYVPDSLTSDSPGKLNLPDDREAVTVTGTPPGIVSITLPPTVAPLEIGKKYSWSFRIACDPTDRFGGYSVVGGWIQRIKPDDRLKKQLEKAATSRERALLYAKAGIWYDSVTELCSSSAKDTNLATDWTALLQSIHLDEVKEQTVPCGAIKQ